MGNCVGREQEKHVDVVPKTPDVLRRARPAEGHQAPPSNKPEAGHSLSKASAPVETTGNQPREPTNGEETPLEHFRTKKPTQVAERISSVSAPAQDTSKVVQTVVNEEPNKVNRTSGLCAIYEDLTRMASVDPQAQVQSGVSKEEFDSEEILRRSSLRDSLQMFEAKDAAAKIDPKDEVLRGGFKQEPAAVAAESSLAAHVAQFENVL